MDCEYLKQHLNTLEWVISDLISSLKFCIFLVNLSLRKFISNPNFRSENLFSDLKTWFSLSEEIKCSKETFVFSSTSVLYNFC